MNVTEIIKSVGEILNVDLSSVKFDNETQAIKNATVRSILSCCNFVMEDLCREPIAERTRSVVNVEQGVALLPSNVIKVWSLTDGEGRSASFTYADNGINVARDGRYNISYVTAPNELKLNGEIKYPSRRITDRIFIYGVIAEYLRRIGDYAVSQTWREKYDDALRLAETRLSRGTLPVRRWLI